MSHKKSENSSFLRQTGMGVIRFGNCFLAWWHYLCYFLVPGGGGGGHCSPAGAICEILLKCLILFKSGPLASKIAENMLMCGKMDAAVIPEAREL